MDTNNIIEIDLDTAGEEISIFAYYQFDRGLKLRLLNVPDQRDYSLDVEMCQGGATVIQYVFPYTGEDVEIPEELLRNGGSVWMYLFIKGEGWGKTILKIDLKLSHRPEATR